MDNPQREATIRYVPAAKRWSVPTSLARWAALVPILTGTALAQLPEGSGKESVEGVCTACHEINQITRSGGYTKDDWTTLTGTMVDFSGAPEVQNEIAAYLARHFPPNERRAPTRVPGPLSIAFTEWQVPTLGQRSRDPIEAADGTIWWAGQWANLVGQCLLLNDAGTR
jgi:virginiamycin B lyase